MLQATDVWFGYDERAPVVRGVSLSVPPAGIIGILGPNGSGKTTLLRMLAGTRHPQRGTVTLDSVSLTALSRTALARRMAVVPQETQLAFDYTVAEVAMMGRYPHLGAFEIEGPADLAVIEETLTSTGTLHLKDRLFATLSGGEKQRVVIAAALAQIFRGSFRLKAEATSSHPEATGSQTEATSPSNNSTSSPDNSTGSSDNSTGSSDNSTGSSDNSTGSSDNSTGSSDNSTGSSDNSTGSSDNFAGSSDNSRGFRLQAEEASSGYLLLDEPTASLDLGYQLEVASLLRQLHENRRVAIVISTHDLGLAATLCDSLMLIRDGLVIANGPTDAVLTPDNVRQAYGVEAEVIRHASGRRIVVPLRRTGERERG